MGFKIKIIMHSVSPKGKELVTYKLRFPCEILAEVNTHTILSKSAQSMRAVPYPEVRRMILEDPWIPPFGTRKAGMVAGEELRGQEAETARRIWLDQRGAAIKAADQLSEMRTAKQVVNRLIQPWAWTNQVLTGTDWPNFFAQRTDTNAHPAFQRLSRAMWVAYSRSVPVRLDYNEWHAPFVGHGSQQQLLDKMLAAGTIDQAGIDLAQATLLGAGGAGGALRSELGGRLIHARPESDVLPVRRARPTRFHAIAAVPCGGWWRPVAARPGAPG